MSDTVIRVENLGKKYVIGHKQEGERYTALRDVIANGAKGAVKRFRNPGKALRTESEEFWALKDVSFEIKRGDRIGVIGRNGAGKSTLLKTLSRITEPTEGQIRITGRVASLLEVGTGFHPELTGRENIYLNGAILGMEKTEIFRKFDEIVAFAEVEKFLDTPVKRYSSGMYVRLAFSVAAHLEPEILIVDEVLAVGDAQFQKKCLGKMEDAGKDGKTVLFVSHNMAAIRSLCTQGIFLQEGRVQKAGDIVDVIDFYERNSALSEEKICGNLKYFYLHSASISSADGGTLKTFEPAKIQIVFSGKQQLLYPDVYLSIKNDTGQNIAGFQLTDIAEVSSIPPDKSLRVNFNISSLPLMPGQYRLLIELKDLSRSKCEFVPNEMSFEVVDVPVYGTKEAKPWHGYLGLDVKPSLTAVDRISYLVDA